MGLGQKTLAFQLAAARFGTAQQPFREPLPMVIGKLYRAADLGFYTRASTLAMLPASL